MSSLATAPSPGAAAAPLARVRALRRAPLGGALIAAALAAVAFVAGGGQDVPSSSFTEVALIAGGALLAGAALWLPAAQERVYGGPALWLFTALAVWTAVSLSWSVSGEDTWVESGRTLSYLAVFGGGLCLARIAPRSAPALLGGLLTATTLIAGYALLTKIFPGTFAADQIYARLRAPFDYWNAVGVSAALGVPAALWLGSRRDGRPALGALAYPAAGVLLLTVLLAYSRGSLLALGVGLVLWFAVTPLRLRGALLLILAGAGAGVVAAWSFAQDALSNDGVDLAPRITAGHDLGLWTLALVLALTAAGLAARFGLAHGPFPARLRKRSGIAVLGLVVLALAGGLAALQSKPGGISGQVSHGWHQLTNVHATIPANQPSRLTSAGSVRARYWNEALEVWKEHRVRGVGAGGFALARQAHSVDTARVLHAHGYAVQTLADLGLVGAGISLLLLLTWGRAALRAAPLRRRLGVPATERAATLTVLTVVVVYGVHSLVDWTWFIPGPTVAALLAAGWLAGRGPLGAGVATVAPARVARRSVREEPLRLAAGFGLAAAVLVAAWAVLGPWRSANADDRALARLTAGDVPGARAAIADARRLDPLSPEPLFLLATVEQASGHDQAALTALRRAVRLVPRSSEPWLRLATFELDTLNRPAAALADYQGALAVDPNSKAAVAGFIQARTAIGG